ncbi:MAG: hypothetical protein JSW62_03045 [Thermoplasmatales archaeon]|nr:MAG: hypothetical protein JSW62_03045 [Thermoplasmatales archaeon]
MKNIKELVENAERYKKAIIQKSFKSKKNTVAYVTLDGKPRILKWFVPGLKKNMQMEYNILKKGSSGLNIPNLYEMDEVNNVLILNYIIGENLCDIVNDEETTITEKQRLMILLAKWFAKFHNHFKSKDDFYIRGDPSLRNFILTDRIWGVDFEEARIGKPIEDIAGICSSILSTDPMFTSEKFELCRNFVEYYAKSVTWNLTKFNEEIAYALLERIQWRPDHEKILREYSKKIRENGLIL